MLGSHNHASVKYGPTPAVTAFFDDVSYPAAPASGQTYVAFKAYGRTAAPATVVVGGVSFPFTPRTSVSGSFAESVPVTGSGAVTVTGFTTVANVELVAG
jgi:hypothetical protein